MPGGEFHAGESGLLPQRHRPHLSADAAGPGVPQAGLFSQAFADKLNDFVFKVGLPVMLFKDLVESDFFTVWDGPFVLFCFLATLGSILLTAALSLFCRERPCGEFIQVGYRSSIALLGAAFLENLYGTAGAASLVIIGAVPSTTWRR